MTQNALSPFFVQNAISIGPHKNRAAFHKALRARKKRERFISILFRGLNDDDDDNDDNDDDDDISNAIERTRLQPRGARVLSIPHEKVVCVRENRRPS